MDLLGAPAWSEQCASPKNQGYHGHNVTSPTNSYNNYYGSPVISPGNWNASSPYDGSNYSYPSPDSSFQQGSPNGSTPPVTPSSVSSSSTNHTELELTSELGKDQGREKVKAKDLRREKVANFKAKTLMRDTFGSSLPATLSSVSSSTNHNELELPSELGKEHIEESELDQGREIAKAKDLRREKVANAKAKMLMQDSFGGYTKKVEEPRTQVRGGMTARQAAAKRYEEQNKLKEVSKARYKEEKQILKPAATLVAPTTKEKLASSTRKKKKATAEEDFETISDFKCQLDFDRERSAKKKALVLLYSLSGCA
jgi:hypothetical protein